MGASARVHVYGDWDGSGVKKAQQDLSIFEKQASGFSSSFTKSMLGAGAALGGAFAVGNLISSAADFMRDAAMAAMEDEKSLVALAKAMSNVGLASKNAEAEGLIKSMSLQFGIADDQLRPAYQRLVTATKDVGQSQRLLQTAMDISAAGYTDLEAAAKALSAASMGNFTALQRLKLPLDANTIASKDFEGAIAQLNQTVGGQAAAAAETYQGKLNRITVAANEAKETIGYALLQSIDKASQSFGGAGGITSAIAGAGDMMANFVKGLGAGILEIERWSRAVQHATGVNQENGMSIWDMTMAVYKAMPGTGLLISRFERMADLGSKVKDPTQQAADAVIHMGQSAAANAARVDGFGGALGAAAIDATNAANAVADAAVSVLSLSSAMDVYTKVGYTPGGVLLPGQDLAQQQLTDRMKASLAATRQGIAAINAARSAARDGGSGGSSTAKAKDEFVLFDAAMRRVLQTVNRTASGYDDLTRELGGEDIAAFSRKMLAAGKITSQTKDEFEAMVGTIKDRLNTALDAAKQKVQDWQQKYDSLLSTVQSGIAQGNGIADAAQAQADAAQALADAQKAYDDAVAGGNADEIAKTGTALDRAKAKQGTFLSFLQMGVDSAEAFSQQIQELTKANASLEVVQQIVQMGAKTGSRVAAELLAGGAAAIENANRMVSAVGKAALDAGTLAAQTFYGAGLASAQAYVSALETAVQPLLQSLLDRIAAQISAALKSPVNSSLASGESSAPPTSATVAAAALGAYAPTTPGAGPNIPSGEGRIYAELMALSRRAAGGPVSGGSAYLVGEVGPELFIPGSSGRIVPNNALGGNSYTINVSTGVGDPRMIGEQIVSYIKRFEAASGSVFAAA